MCTFREQSRVAGFLSNLMEMAKRENDQKWVFHFIVQKKASYNSWKKKETKKRSIGHHRELSGKVGFAGARNSITAVEGGYEFVQFLLNVPGSLCTKTRTQKKTEGRIRLEFQSNFGWKKCEKRPYSSLRPIGHVYRWSGRSSSKDFRRIHWALSSLAVPCVGLENRNRFKKMLVSVAHKHV